MFLATKAASGFLIDKFAATDWVLTYLTSKLPKFYPNTDCDFKVVLGVLPVDFDLTFSKGFN